VSELRAQESRNVFGTAVHVRIKWLLSPLDTHLKMKIVRKSGSSHGIALPHVKSAFATFSNSTHRKALLVCSARPYSRHAWAGRFCLLAIWRTTSNLNSRLCMRFCIVSSPCLALSLRHFGEVDFVHCPVSGVHSRDHPNDQTKSHGGSLDRIG
jgi:hypothetical protein